MLVSIYSILHLLVDGVCALAMFGRFALTEHWGWSLLIYNFCAFALQMPLGTVIGLFGKKQKSMAYPFAVLGVLLTMIGAFTNPLLLGIGNALFHVGGGVDVIREDRLRTWKGSALGIFVAPGALGLYLGTQFAKNIDANSYNVILIATGILMSIGIFLLFRMDRKEKKILQHTDGKISKGTILFIMCCFLVVILRSYIGMAVSFPWKTTVWIGLLSVLAVVFGKMAGGILAARIKVKKVVIVSLLLAAVGYLLSETMFGGMSALFFFNMTMPITLYLLVEELKDLPGFSFGLLTFGLFLGFLPVYFDMKMPIDATLLGAVGSIVSLALLMAAVKLKGDGNSD